jgi:ABC-type nickel/cobalt efflux system permease component RcnA
MNKSILTTVAITGFGVAFLHAAIPTHWLPFVLTARLHKWNRAKTLLITAIAGTGHATFTAALGVIVAWLGSAISDRIGIWFPRIAGGVLIVLGLFYVVGQLIGKPHTHFHLGRSTHSHSHDHDREHNDDHDHDHGVPPRMDESLSFSRSDIAPIGSLLALLTFSPCEAFLPIYVSGIRYGWYGFVVLTVILTVATISGMVAFTALALAGIEQVKLRAFEKFEAGMIGALLSLVGVLIILFEK